MAGALKFKLTIMDPDKLIYDGEASSLFLQGNTGEYEILPYHYPVLGLLKKGKVFIDWKYYIEIVKGVVRFFKNECIIIVELQASKRKQVK